MPLRFPCALRPACLALTCIATSIHGADRRPDADRFTIVTWNTRFLFDGQEPEGEASFPWKGDVSAARAHLRAVAEVLRPLDADFIHVSEVEDLATLERLAVEIGDPTYRAFLVPGRDTVTRQNVGFLTRVDPVEPPGRTDASFPAGQGGPRQAVSKNYFVHLRLGDLSLVVVGLHLLAFPQDPERTARREAQAEVLRRLAVEEATRHGRHVLVAGDFNEYDSEIPDVAGNVALSSALAILRAVDEETLEDDLLNAALWLPSERRFTAFVDRNANGIDDGPSERSLTDHVLVPRAFAAAVRAVGVASDHEPLTGPSDHFPLAVTLDLTRLRLFRRGDVDASAVVDLGDAAALFSYLTSGAMLPCTPAGDGNDDGAIDLGDVLVLLNHLFRLGPALPPPGPLLPGPDLSTQLPAADAPSCVPRVGR